MENKTNSMPLLALIGLSLLMSMAALGLALVAFAREDSAAPDAYISKSSEPGAYTKAFVDKAINRYDGFGREDTISHYNTKGSIDGDWYVFIIDENGAIVSHAARPERLGLTFADMVDVNGYNYGADFAAAKEGDWVTYSYLNPNNGEYERKHSWVVNRDGLIFGSGWYERSIDSLLPSKSQEPAAYTKAFVEKAIRRYQAQGRDATLAYYNSMESVDDGWYIFVIENDKVIIHPIVPENIGQDLNGPLGIDAAGHRFGPEILTATEHGKWVEYSQLDPVTGEEGRKRSWVMRHDGLIFGSGWYER